MQVESFLELSAQQTPHKTALICNERRVSYRDADDGANRLAHSLKEAGIVREDRVAVYLDNSVEAVLAVFAILKAGAVFLVVNPSTKADKLKYILNNCRAKGLITDRAKLSRIQEQLAGAEHLTALWVANGTPETTAVPGKHLLSLNAVLNDPMVPDGPPAKKCIDIDLAALIYTSGSTGRPKGVMLTHLNVVSAATSITTYLENTPDDIIINLLPLS